jgi:type II secretory pathway pseudopilin PulG
VLAFTLVELMVATALGMIVLAVVGALTVYSGRSFVAIANYVGMDQASQLALDKMSREIRQAHRLIEFSPTRLTFEDPDRQQFTFDYDPQARTLVRIRNGTTNVYLVECDSLAFSKYQRTTISNTFDAYAPAFVTNSRLIHVSWTCSRTILGAKVNTESVQAAKIVLRNN